MDNYSSILKLYRMKEVLILNNQYIGTGSITETDAILFHEKLNNRINELQKDGHEVEIQCNSVMVGSNLAYTAFILTKSK